jgi:hypothetical protein
VLSNGRTNHHHHLFPHTQPTPSIAPHGHFQWHAHNRAPAARFRDLGITPPIPLALSNGRTHHHHHLFLHTPPIPSIALHSRFRWRARNRAPAARFCYLHSKPPTPLALFISRTHRHRHLIPHSQPTPSITPSINFHQRT